jgi:hypothetical protein
MSVCPSVRTSVRMEQLGFHRTDFYEIWYLRIFRKSVKKIQVLLKSDKKTGTLHEDQYIFFVISRSFLLRMSNVSDENVEKIKTRILCSVTFFFRKSCHIWDNVKKFVERCRPQMMIRCMRLAYWIPKAAKTHTQYVIMIAFPLQQWLHGRGSVLCYTYIACLVEP